MSTTIELHLERIPASGGLLAAIGHQDLCCRPAPADPEAPWPEGICQLYRGEVSTRAIEIRREGPSLTARLFTLSSAVDVELAVRFLEQAAALGGSTRVDCELLGRLEVGELRASLDASWTEHQNESGARVLATLIREGRGPIEVPGAVRSLHLGPRSLGELEAEPADRPFHRRLLDRFWRVQWPGEAYPAAAVFQAETEARGTIRFAVWLGRAVFLPAVDVVALRLDEESSPFFVEAAAVLELAGSRWTWLDERQGLIEACDDWPAVVERARALEVDLRRGQPE